MITSIADLLHPNEPAALRAAAGDDRRLLLHTDRAAQFAKLISWERFNDLVTADKVLAGDIEFVRNNAMLPAEMTIVRPKRQRPPTRMRTTALDHYTQQGVSVVINGLDEMDPEIRRLNAIIERMFRARVHANLYASFGSDSAFKPHWDDHNVLVLQLHGRKLWRSWGQRWRAPISHALHKVPETLGEPEWQAMLEPGDVLYLPRGEIHAAKIRPGEDSMHLTIGITPPRLDALTTAMAEACQSEVIGRQDLPIFAERARSDAWMRDAREALHRAVDTLDLEQILGALDRRVEPLPAGFLGSDRRLAPATLVLPTLRRPLSHVETGQGEPCEDHRVINAGSQSWNVDGTERRILDLTMQDAAFTLAQLAARLAEDGEPRVEEAVVQLARRGLVLLRSPADQE